MGVFPPQQQLDRKRLTRHIVLTTTSLADQEPDRWKNTRRVTLYPLALYGVVALVRDILPALSQIIQAWSAG